MELSVAGPPRKERAPPFLAVSAPRDLYRQAVGTQLRSRKRGWQTLPGKEVRNGEKPGSWRKPDFAAERTSLLGFWFLY